MINLRRLNIRKSQTETMDVFRFCFTLTLLVLTTLTSGSAKASSCDGSSATGSSLCWIWGVNNYCNSQANSCARTKVSEIFENPMLTELFPTTEAKNQAIAAIMTEVEATTGSTVADIELKKTTAATNAAIKVIVARAFDQNNVRSQEQKAFWQTELLKEYNSCAAGASSSTLAGCKDKLFKEMPENLGNAIVIATAKEDLVPSEDTKGSRDYPKIASDRFKTCFKAGKKSAEDDLISRCAKESLFATIKDLASDELKSAKEKYKIPASNNFEVGILKGLDTCLENVLKNTCTTAQTKAQAQVQTSAHPTINCIPQKEMRPKAKACAAQVRAKAVTEIAKHTILNDESIAKSIPPGVDKNQLAEKLGARVAACYEGNSPNASQCVQNVTANFKKDTAIDIAHSQIDAAAADAGNLPPEEAALLRNLQTKYKGQFEKCIREAATEAAFQSCVSGDFKKMTERNATREMGLLLGKGKIKELINMKDDNPAFVKIKTEFEACLNSPSSEASQCLAKYRTSITKMVAGVTLNYRLGKLLGKDGLTKNKKEIDAMLAKFGACVEKAETSPASRTAETEKCTQSLHQAGAQFAETAAMRALVGSKKGQVTGARREAVRNIIETAKKVTGDTGAPTPGEDMSAALASLPQKGILEDPKLKVVRDYIEYDPAAAARQTAQVRASVDQTGPIAADQVREQLYRKLEDASVTDQLIKAMIRKEVQDGLSKIKGSDAVSPAVLSKILSSQNFDKIFTKKVIADLGAKNSLVRPLLVGGKSESDPSIVAAKAALKKKVGNILVNSSHFGSILAQSTIKKQIANQDGMTKFFANLFYGSNALNWDVKRKTPQGQAAEKYIQTQIIGPMMTGSLSEAEKARRIAHAEGLIKSAVTGQAVATNPGGRRSSGSGRGPASWEHDPFSTQ